MFRKTNHNQQLSLFGNPSMTLKGRAAKVFNNPASWHNQFYALVTSKIDEELFKPLFKESPTGAPTKNICRLVAMMAYKEGCGCSDAELERAVDFDLQLRAALGLSSLEDMAPSIDSYYLFRRRLLEYKERTGIDLYIKSFQQITGQQAKVFNISGKSVRMDSKLIGSNIAWYSRYQIVHATLCKSINKSMLSMLKDSLAQEVLDLIGEDAKKTIYESDQNTIESKFAAMGRVIYNILVDLKIKDGLLHRVFYEQYNLVRDKDENNNEKGPKRPEPKDKKDIEATSVQNPNDPEAQYRRKGEQRVRGYSTNITETVDDSGDENPKPSLIVDVQVEGATTADNSYVKDAIVQSEECTGDTVDTIYVDGAYQSEGNRQFAQEHGIELIATGIPGKETRYDLNTDENGNLIVVDKLSGETIKAERRNDKWRIPIKGRKDKYRYFSQEQIDRAAERRRQQSIHKEKLNNRNNVEATIFQYCFHTRNNKTRYRGLEKHRMQAYSRCMWMNFVKLAIFNGKKLQEAFYNVLSLILALWNRFWTREIQKITSLNYLITFDASSESWRNICRI